MAEFDVQSTRKQYRPIRVGNYEVRPRMLADGSLSVTMSRSSDALGARVEVEVLAATEAEAKAKVDIVKTTLDQWAAAVAAQFGALP